jgi:DNA-binding MarR family transcriptional regulator
MNKQAIQEELMTLAYQIARQMRRQMGDSSRNKLHDKVSPYQLHVLFHLSHQVTTMGELAEEMNITLPSATSLVDRLVKNGWVERGFDPDDRRVIRLSTTEAGRTLCTAMKAERYRAFEFLLDAMPAADVAALYRIFTNLHAALDAKKTEATKPKEG